MTETPTGPADDGRATPPGDRAAERALRAEVRDEIERLLGERQLLSPGPGEEDRIRLLIAERVAAHQRRAATTNAPLLEDPAGLERRLFDALLRLGVLEPLMADGTVEEIMVNSPHRVWVIEAGRTRLAPDVYFDDDEEVRALVKRVVGPLGRRLDEASPLVDAKLPDGSRLNAVIPPASTRGTAVTIRKYVVRRQTLAELTARGTLSEAARRFLEAAVNGAVNILISGSTGSGKTTLLTALCTAIEEPSTRLVTIEEVPELQLDRLLPNCVALQSRGVNVEGAGEIRIRELLKNALRMRPDRIVVGEVRGGEALDMLQAMNTGHDGSLSTIHGASPRDALSRLVTLASMAEERLSGETLTRMVARTIELVVQLRFEPKSGRRRIESIFEVVGLEGDTVVGNELFGYEPSLDRLVWRGIPPRCLAKMAARGVAYAPPPAEERP